VAKFAPTTAGCPKGAEEGNVVGSRIERREHPRQRHASGALLPGTRPCSVLRLVHLSRLGHATPRKWCGAVWAGALEEASRSGNPAQAGRTGTGALRSERCAARRAPPLPQGRQRGAYEKEGGHGLRPCEDTRARALSPFVVVVAEIGRRRPASNTLTQRTPKRAAARVNGGLARGRLRRKRRRQRRAKRRTAGRPGIGDTVQDRLRPTVA
jgi:hypothetical protein